MAVVVESIWLRLRFEKVESEIKVRECGEEKERACTNVAFLCVVSAAGICSETGQFAVAKGWLLALWATAVKNAGQSAECRESLEFCCFHASTCCVICLWRREEIGGWCLALFDCGQQGLFVVCFCGVVVQSENG